MAIKGFLNSKTYCSIGNTIYEKDTKRCSVNIKIFEDETKKNVVASTGVVVEGEFLIPSIVSLTPQKTIPENLGESYFIVADESSEELIGFEGRLAHIDKSTKELHTYFLNEVNIFQFFAEDEKKYYMFEKGNWEIIKNHTRDKRIWDEWFAPEVALADGTNPTKQMYKFMKTLDQFKDCEDV